MDCLKLHFQCKAECCGPCPIPLETWQRRQSQVQGKIETAIADDEGFVHAVTVDGNCPFKRSDCTCAIYPAPGEADERNEVCAKFGDESHPCMTCRWQDSSGRVRSRGERRQVSREISSATGLIINNLRQQQLGRRVGR